MNDLNLSFIHDLPGINISLSEQAKKENEGISRFTNNFISNNLDKINKRIVKLNPSKEILKILERFYFEAQDELQLVKELNELPQKELQIYSIVKLSTPVRYIDGDYLEVINLSTDIKIKTYNYCIRMIALD